MDAPPKCVELMDALHAKKADLDALWKKYQEEWRYADPVYRMYHGSFKVYGLTSSTREIVKFLSDLLPGQKLNEDFLTIYYDGTHKTFEEGDNRRWLRETRPIVEAFFHARFMLDMAVRCAEYEKAPAPMIPSDWAALLYLYNLR